VCAFILTSSLPVTADADRAPSPFLTFRAPGVDPSLIADLDRVLDGSRSTRPVCTSGRRSRRPGLCSASRQQGHDGVYRRRYASAEIGGALGVDPHRRQPNRQGWQHLRRQHQDHQHPHGRHRGPRLRDRQGRRSMRSSTPSRSRWPSSCGTGSRRPRRWDRRPTGRRGQAGRVKPRRKPPRSSPPRPSRREVKPAETKPAETRRRQATERRPR